MIVVIYQDGFFSYKSQFKVKLSLLLVRLWGKEEKKRERER